AATGPGARRVEVPKSGTLTPAGRPRRPGAGPGGPGRAGAGRDGAGPSGRRRSRPATRPGRTACTCSRPPAPRRTAAAPFWRPGAAGRTAAPPPRVAPARTAAARIVSGKGLFREAGQAFEPNKNHQARKPDLRILEI